MYDKAEADRVRNEVNAWNSSIPQFAVYHESSSNLGRCYNGYTMRIESRRELNSDSIGKLRAAKILGYGQEFYIRSDLSVRPEVKVYRFKPTGTNPIDGKPYAELTREVYVYRVEDRVDSSD